MVTGPVASSATNGSTTQRTLHYNVHSPCDEAERNIVVSVGGANHTHRLDGQMHWPPGEKCARGTSLRTIVGVPAACGSRLNPRSAATAVATAAAPSAGDAAGAVDSAGVAGTAPARAMGFFPARGVPVALAGVGGSALPDVFLGDFPCVGVTTPMGSASGRWMSEVPGGNADADELPADGAGVAATMPVAPPDNSRAISSCSEILSAALFAALMGMPSTRFLAGPLLLGAGAGDFAEGVVK